MKPRIGSFSASLPSLGSRGLRVTPATGHGTIGAPSAGKLSGRCADSPQGATYHAVRSEVRDCTGGGNQIRHLP